jgi:hypothetical protein
MDPKFNFERDLHRSDKIAEKVQNLSYARDLYAALCNNEWVPKDVMELLKNEGYNCSWRYAGSIVARLRGRGDYMDFYCSSIDDYATSEGVVTNEIEDDLNEIGWVLKGN